MQSLCWWLSVLLCPWGQPHELDKVVLRNSLAFLVLGEVLTASCLLSPHNSTTAVSPQTSQPRGLLQMYFALGLQHQKGSRSIPNRLIAQTTFSRNSERVPHFLVRCVSALSLTSPASSLPVHIFVTIDYMYGCRSQPIFLRFEERVKV